MYYICPNDRVCVSQMPCGQPLTPITQGAARKLYMVWKKAGHKCEDCIDFRIEDKRLKKEAERAV